VILGVNGIRLIGKRSGVARVIESILRAMGELDQPFDDIRVYTPRPVEDEVKLPRIARNVIVESKLPNALWEQITLPRAHGDRDLLFCPSYVVPLFARCPTFLVHHGSYEGYPAAFDRWTLLKARAIYTLSAWRASAVSTVSESSKRDMVRYYRMDAARIDVVPDGVDTRVFRPLLDREQSRGWRMRIFGDDVPYLAYVGKPTERRQLTPLLRAYADLKKEGAIDHRFLIAGADLPGTSPFRRVIAELGIDRDVSILDYVAHDEMPLLYNAADLLCYPSSYEGFGMPVLEAMACGTPVIALDNTALPEFAGGVALLLKDAEVGTLKRGIQTVLGDRELRARMAADGPRRAAAYDWKTVTRRYLELMLPLVASQRSAA
jgi:glycosyltransferase involved in cell wall biosynthesis